MADLIVRGKLVLTMNEALEAVPNGAVAVAGSRIVAVGPADEILAAHGAGAKVLNAPGGVVMPGLVNAHTHIPMTCFRGLADDLPLMEWLTRHIFPAEAKLNADIVYWGAMLGCAEMIMSGTTYLCDMYLFEDAVARAVDRSGLRAMLGEVLYDFPSPNYGPPEKGLRFTESLIMKYRGHERIEIAVMPHALYTCSPDLLTDCGELAARLGAPLVTHLSETRSEVEGVKAKYGLTPVRHVHKLGLLNSNLIADHCVVLDDEEIRLLADSGARVAHCPSSNLKLASGVAPVPELLAAGVRVGLGTDGPASNNCLDMFNEMGLAARLHKVAKMDPTAMPAEKVLSLAIRDGARVLGKGGQTGQLVPGCLADLIVLDFDQPHLTPAYSPVSHLAYAARGGDVVHNVTHGKILMENRKLTTLDLDEIYARMAQISEIMRCEPTLEADHDGCDAPV